MVRHNVSGDGYVSRNCAYERKTDDRLRPSFEEAECAPHEANYQDKRRIRHQDRRERESIILEYENELRKQHFTEDEILNLVHEFRKGLRTKGHKSTQKEGKNRYGWTKERKRFHRGKAIRLRNEESSNRFAEAFQIQSHHAINRHPKHRNPIDDVFDVKYQENRKQLVRDKRLQSIWKNKLLMERLREDVYAEEYRKIYGCDPNQSS